MLIAVKAELLRCGLLAREEPLVPGRIYNPVARVSVFLLGEERLKERVKRQIPEPAKVALVVVVATSICEERPIVEHADPAYRVARGHVEPPKLSWRAGAGSPSTSRSRPCRAASRTCASSLPSRGASQPVRGPLTLLRLRATARSSVADRATAGQEEPLRSSEHA